MYISIMHTSDIPALGSWIYTYTYIYGWYLYMPREEGPLHLHSPYRI